MGRFRGFFIGILPGQAVSRRFKFGLSRDMGKVAQFTLVMGIRAGSVRFGLAQGKQDRFSDVLIGFCLGLLVLA